MTSRCLPISHVKHGAHAIVADRDIGELTRDLEFFDAEVVIATGHRTGDAVDLGELETIGRATTLPVLVGSGVTGDNVGPILQRSSGVIIRQLVEARWRLVGAGRTGSSASFMSVVEALRSQAG